MASCLVPEFPAVMVALEHLKELGQRLTERGAPPEALRHLGRISAAVSELEAERRAAHELLEVETIENSELRHRIHNLRDTVSEEIRSGVAAVWESRAVEMDKLREDLRAERTLHQEAFARNQELLQQNEALGPERERAQAEHEALLASLREEVNLKLELQEKLQDTQRLMEELESSITAVEQEKRTLELNMTQQREAFLLKKEDLAKEEEQMEENIKRQQEVIGVRRSELEEVNRSKEEAQRSLDELSVQAGELEGTVERLQQSLSQQEERLEEEIQTHQQLQRQRDSLEKDPDELDEAFSLTVRQLREEMLTVEKEVEEERASRLLLQEQLSRAREVYKQQLDEEQKVRVEHTIASQQLERSKLQLEEQITSIIKYRQEVKEMDTQIRELQDRDAVNKRLLRRTQEELHADWETEQRISNRLQQEKAQLEQQLEQLRAVQVEQVEKMTSNISNMRRRYEELQREEAALLQRQPNSINMELLRNHISQTETECRRVENMLRGELQQHGEEMEVLLRSNEEKQRALEEKEAILREEEHKCEEEKNRYEGLTKLSQELRSRRGELEKSIQDLKQNTSSLLESKEKLKMVLQELQDAHIHSLAEETSELRALEVRLYNGRTKLEQVQLENSRLHLAITQMMEDTSRAERDRQRYLQETELLARHTEALKVGLQEAWRKDAELTQEHQSRQEEVLRSMASMKEQLQSRGQHVGELSALLHRHGLDFSRRLGQKSRTGQD